MQFTGVKLFVSDYIDLCSFFTSSITFFTFSSIFQNVIEILRSHSGPGGLHENTFFVVMGDHGQTINGDHGGGTAEEVCASY